MTLFEKLMEFFDNDASNLIVDTVSEQLPSDMSEKDRGELKLVIVKATQKYEQELISLVQKEQLTLNKQIAEMEGTASDLKQAGKLGEIVLFFRGLQRPLWGFAVLFMDMMVFSGSWSLAQANNGNEASLDLQSAFWIVNFLVLGFLFGERAMRNVMPFFQSRLGGAQAKTNNINAMG